MKKQTPVEASNYPDAIVLFDGICNFCNHSVQFILKRDKQHYFRFASLQAPFARTLVETYWRKEKTVPDSILLWEKGKFYSNSTAALRIARKLSGLWPMAVCLLVVPKFLRDGIYEFVARNRYRWFGKKQSCNIEEGRKLKDYVLS